jgi:putative drug exporter of the RND superfamily
MGTLLYGLGRTAVRRRRLFTLAWVLVAIGIFVVAQARGGGSSERFDVPGVEAQQALDMLEDRFPSEAGTSAQLVFAADSGTLSDPNAAAAVDRALADVAAQPDVGRVDELRRSPDGRIAFADVQYKRPTTEIRTEAFDRLEATAEGVNDAGVVQMELGGDLPTEASQEPPAGQEFVGVIAAVIILLVAFGSIIAMGLPIGTAIVGLLTSLGLFTLLASFIDVSDIAPTLGTMIGLGVGIDYALFIVTRHREHLQQGMTVEEAAGRSVATSGSAVVFAGLTVVIAILALAIAGIPAVTVMGVAVAIAVLVMVAIALTLLPALLGFAGHKIDRVTLPFLRGRSAAAAAGRETIWHRWGRQVSAHPWRYLLASVALLGLLTVPLFSLRLGMTDNGTSPESLTTRRSYDLLAEGFGPGFNGPLVLSAELDGASPESLEPLASAIDNDPGVESVAPIQPNGDGSAAVLRVIPETSPQDSATSDLVHRLRDDVIPSATAGMNDVEVYVGGQTALFVDLSDQLAARLPFFIGAVLVVSVLLLMVVFRSIAVPLKAAAMNLLSIGAAYGIIVAVFQWGWLQGMFGVEETVPIVSFMPMMLFAILFGLSMDYEVFLLSRVREEYLKRRDNEAAVVEGISATARVITSAALIMISVFAAFILSDDVVVQMFGLGLATAVFVDATIIRLVLVPATMKLLGDWNWWLPAWLDRLLPRLDIDGESALPAPEYEPGRGPARPAPEREREPEPEPVLVS